MKKVNFYYANDIPFDVDTNKNVDVFIDRIPRYPVEKGRIRFVILEEPRKGVLYKLARNHPHWYTYLLTFHDELLNKSPKLNGRVRHFLLMNTWMKNYIPKKKEFSVSTVVGGKSRPDVPGYAVRHELWRNRERIIIPRKFYLSGNAKHSHTFVPWMEVNYKNELVLGVSKKPLFDSMFHIAIESTFIKHYFSEKILDCFQTKTVPIYIGCRNIDKFFNRKGIFVAYSIDDVVSICNKLTPQIYEDMKPYMEDNYRRAMYWLDPKEQVERIIKKILSEIE